MKLTAKDLMTTTVVAIDARRGVDEALDLLLRHHISGLPVVDPQRRLVGVITERDLLRLLYDPQTECSYVAHFATARVVSVTEDQPLTEVVDLFLQYPFRRLPVVDGEGRLVGVVSRHDVVRLIRDVRLRVSTMIDRKRHAEAAVSHA